MSNGWLSDKEIVAQEVQEFSSIKILDETDPEDLWYHEKTNSDVLSDYHATLETNHGEIFEISMDSQYDNEWVFTCVHPVLLPSSLAVLYDFYHSRAFAGEMGDHIEDWLSSMMHLYKEQAADPLKMSLEKAQLDNICKEYQQHVTELLANVKECLEKYDIVPDKKVADFFSVFETELKSLSTLTENLFLGEGEQDSRNVFTTVFSNVVALQSVVFEEVMYGDYDYEAMKSTAGFFRALKEYTEQSCTVLS